MRRKIIIAIIGIIILIMGVGFWKWKNVKNAEIVRQKVEQQAINMEAQQSNDSVESQQKYDETSLDVSKWKTYRDEKLGFEFKYPENLVRLSGSDIAGVRLHRECSGLKNEDLGVQMRCALESNMSFGITTKKIDQIIEEYKSDCEKDHCLELISSQENYALDGVSGKKLLGKNAEGVGALNYIYVTKNNKNYLVSFVQFDDIYSRIISTFKFIN